MRNHTCVVNIICTLVHIFSFTLNHWVEKSKSFSSSCIQSFFFIHILLNKDSIQYTIRVYRMLWVEGGKVGWIKINLSRRLHTIFCRELNFYTFDRRHERIWIKNFGGEENRSSSHMWGDWKISLMYENFKILFKCALFFLDFVEINKQQIGIKYVKMNF